MGCQLLAPSPSCPNPPSLPPRLPPSQNKGGNKREKRERGGSQERRLWNKLPLFCLEAFAGSLALPRKCSPTPSLWRVLLSPTLRDRCPGATRQSASSPGEALPHPRERSFPGSGEGPGEWWARALWRDSCLHARAHSHMLTPTAMSTHEQKGARQVLISMCLTLTSRERDGWSQGPSKP